MATNVREVADYIESLPPEADFIWLVEERYPDITDAEIKEVAAMLRARGQEEMDEADALAQTIGIATTADIQRRRRSFKVV